MGIQYETGDDFSAGGFLDEPGHYHFIITDATDKPTDKDGKLKDKVMFRINCDVLASTVDGTKDKSKFFDFNYPDVSHSDGGDFVRKIIDRFLIAIGVIDQNQKKAGLTLEPEEWVGRQFVAKLETHEYQGNTYLRIAGADIWHVDDPEAKAYPKNSDALKHLPASQRLIGGKPAPKRETAAVGAKSLDGEDFYL